MKTTIKNKQTRETLTGEVTYDLTNAFFFKISGTTVGVEMRRDEWDILPPPLPTGIGSVVRNNDGVYISIDATEYRWKLRGGGMATSYSDRKILESKGLEILSHGVEL